MKIALRLVDGREVVDELAQVTVANAHGEPVLVAYHGPAGAIVCGHRDEDGWNQFLEDTGVVDRLSVGRSPAQLYARVTPVAGSVALLPVDRCVVCSDQGDPAIAAVAADDSVDVAHAGDRCWVEFCRQHEIFIPRAARVQELI